MTTKKKKNHGKKMGITRPRPDGGVTNKENLVRFLHRGKPHNVTLISPSVSCFMQETHCVTSQGHPDTEIRWGHGRKKHEKIEGGPRSLDPLLLDIDIVTLKRPVVI